MIEQLNSDHIHLDIGQEQVTIRPITPEDKAIEAAFVHNLSLETKHERFFVGIKDLSLYMLKKLCDIDYVTTMAYVATVQSDGAEKEIGVVRYAAGANESERELAVTVADAYSFQDLALPLMDALLKHAKANNVKRLFSIELTTNYRFHELATRLGMHAASDPDNGGQMIYSLNI